MKSIKNDVRLIKWILDNFHTKYVIVYQNECLSLSDNIFIDNIFA